MIRKWEELSTPPGLPDTRLFVCGPLRAIVAREMGRMHLSISARNWRYPTFDEIADARYDLLPDGIDMAMVFPPMADYVNHRNVFHLWQVIDTGLPIERGLAMRRTYESGIAPK